MRQEYDEGPVIIVNGGLGSKELIKDKGFGVKDWEEALDSVNYHALTDVASCFTAEACQR
ncbi:hypothetical protein [Saccharolobus islandicus]|uniref:hypothetical protein n=1 Tax=Saccharolobus islandicus TaxID=43080 RepID=UPI000A7C0C87|nr:hypothetical protein [Sulfolobus islandicus]